MNEVSVVGWETGLSWPICRWRWWREPVRAERLAAMRIVLAGVLLLDLLLTYWPNLSDFFGRNGLGDQSIFGFYTSLPSWRWSLVRGIENPAILQVALGLWLAATFCLMIGLFTRPSALISWV